MDQSQPDDSRMPSIAARQRTTRKRIEKWARRCLPSTATISYNPVFRMVGNICARIIEVPFSEGRLLPPNHLRVRVGTGNRILNNLVYNYSIGNQFWLA